MKHPPESLRMEEVSKRFATPRSPITVLESVNLTLHRGDFAALMGPSGSGKTTFLNLAALLDRPTSGSIHLGGHDTTNLDEQALTEHRKYRVGMVFQRFCLLSHRTVLENVLFRFRYLNTSRVEALRLSRAALAETGLAAHADQSARLLSGGEMQRVAIARAIALPPELLLVDEPTGNLDRESAESVMQIFAGLNRRGITILLATHNPALLGFCGRHFICRDGQVTASRGGP